jgi:NAD(P)-dependent dehydrogenase (short-subunit alcohol dehydrogenase family)
MTVAVVTGATRGLGLALVEALKSRVSTVYLTGRDPSRVASLADSLSVEGATLDVANPVAASRFASVLRERHGGVDIVFNNAVMRIGPSDPPPSFIDEYTEVNNFGTTRVLRAFAPLLRDNGRLLVVASSLGTLEYLAPVLHHRFDGLTSLDEVDAAVARWRDAVKSGKPGAWPAFVNIPSKIGQVAAVRALAHERRAADAARGILVAAVCPGMLNTPTSAEWWDVSDAPTPAEAAGALLDLAVDPVKPDHYGELVRFGAVVPWHVTGGR